MGRRVRVLVALDVFGVKITKIEVELLDLFYNSDTHDALHRINLLLIDD
jgi:hypothetical protein